MGSAFSPARSTCATTEVSLTRWGVRAERHSAITIRPKKPTMSSDSE